MKITHINTDGSMILNNGSTISYVIRNDYSGHMFDRFDKKELKRIIKRPGWREYNES